MPPSTFDVNKSTDMGTLTHFATDRMDLYHPRLNSRFCENSELKACYCHWRTFKITNSGTNQKPVCNFLFMANKCLHHFWDNPTQSWKSAFFCHFDPPVSFKGLAQTGVLGTDMWNSVLINLSSWASCQWKMHAAMFSFLELIMSSLNNQWLYTFNATLAVSE